MIDAGPARGRLEHFDRVDIGAKMITWHAVKAFGGKHVLGRQLFRLINPSPYLRLWHAQVARHLAIASCTIAAEAKRFVTGEFFIHEATYTEAYRVVNVFVACAAIQIRIGGRNG